MRVLKKVISFLFLIIAHTAFLLQGEQIVLETAKVASALLQNPAMQKALVQVSTIGLIKSYQYLKNDKSSNLLDKYFSNNAEEILKQMGFIDSNIKNIFKIFNDLTEEKFILYSELKFKILKFTKNK